MKKKTYLPVKKQIARWPKGWTGKKTKKRQYKEHNHQKTIFDWAKMYETKIPALRLLQGSLVGVNLTPQQARRAKDIGVKAGFPDINLPIPRGGYAGLYIELKTDKGKLSPEQKKNYGFVRFSWPFSIDPKGLIKQTHRCYCGISERQHC